MISVKTSSRARRTVAAPQVRSPPSEAATYCTDSETVAARVPRSKSWLDQAAEGPGGVEPGGHNPAVVRATVVREVDPERQSDDDVVGLEALDL